MKKTIFLKVLVILLIFISLSACTYKKKIEANTVTIYMWGGSDSINEYIDKWVAPKLKEEKGIELKRVPINSPKDIINKLITEKQAGKEKGSADIIMK